MEDCRRARIARWKINDDLVIKDLATWFLALCSVCDLPAFIQLEALRSQVFDAILNLAIRTGNNISCYVLERIKADVSWDSNLCYLESCYKVDFTIFNLAMM